MADSYTQMSESWVLPSRENVCEVLDFIKANEWKDSFCDNDVAEQPEFNHWNDGNTFGIYFEESGDLEHVAEVLAFMAGLLNEPVSIEYAFVCSKPRAGEFGGGACVAFPDGRIEWMSTNQWISETISGNVKL